MPALHGGFRKGVMCREDDGERDVQTRCRFGLLKEEQYTCRENYWLPSR
jgi:hypothetical protein